MPWPFKKPKSKPSFRELAPEGLCDLHTHILPGLDDGAANMDESMTMLDRLEQLGYVSVVTTPHFVCQTLTPSVETQAGLIKEIEKRRGKQHPALSAGAEIYFDDTFMAEEEKGGLPRIGQERIYLIEFGFNPGSVPLSIEETFFRFQVRGGTLVLAHPERIPDLMRDPARLKLVSRAGALLQIDVMSLAGKYGSAAKKLALRLVEEGEADLVASDVHSSNDLPSLEHALRDLADWDEAEFRRLASSNPLRILDGRVDEVVRHG